MPATTAREIDASSNDRNGLSLKTVISKIRPMTAPRAETSRKMLWGSIMEEAIGTGLAHLQQNGGRSGRNHYTIKSWEPYTLRNRSRLCNRQPYSIQHRRGPEDVRRNAL